MKIQILDINPTPSICVSMGKSNENEEAKKAKDRKELHVSPSLNKYLKFFSRNFGEIYMTCVISREKQFEMLVCVECIPSRVVIVI